MKNYKILIRGSDGGKFGSIIEWPGKDSKDIPTIMELIGYLEVIKMQQLKKLGNKHYEVPGN